MDHVDARVVWQGKLQFVGSANESGLPLHLDANPEAGGENRGVRPVEALLIGLGGCTGMDVITILRKMRQDVTSYEVLLHGERAPEHPKVYTDITVEHVVTGRKLDRSSVETAVRLSEAKYCSVSNTLVKGTRVTHTPTIRESTPLEAAPQAGDPAFRVSLKVPYAQVLERVVAELKSEGFGVITRIDVQATLKERLGVDFRPYTILGACNPGLPHRALSATLDVGLLLPCNVTVHATDRGSEVALVDPMAMLGLVHGPELEAVATEARAKLQRVAQQLQVNHGD